MWLTLACSDYILLSMVVAQCFNQNRRGIRELMVRYTLAPS